MATALSRVVMIGTPEGPSHEEARHAMVEEQLRGRDICDPRVLSAMERVPRHLFVPTAVRPSAHEDRPLSIGSGKTISQPYMVAKMVEALAITPSDRVLDVGTGSGYQAAILAELAAEVWSIEIVPELAARARVTLRSRGYENVHVADGDGSLGLPEHAPFDAIAVAAGSPDVPRALVEQLSSGGRLVIPVGGLGTQSLRRITRRAGGVTSESLLPCAYVPLLGAQGWAPRPTR